MTRNCTETAVAAFLILALAGSLEAQGAASVPSVESSGPSIVPVFEGWYRNDDGTFTLQFGYFSRNVEDVVHIPAGADNVVAPARYDGRQPTRFLPQPRDRGAGRGIRYWGVFTVAVPADFGDREVTWTLRTQGRTTTVPGHLRSELYELDPAPAGRDGPPALRFTAAGPEGRGPTGATTSGLRAKVGERVHLDVQVTDSGTPGSPVTLRWFEYGGPGGARFPDGRVNTVAQGERAGVQAVFETPGAHVVWVLATNAETEFDRYCCWTNGYVHVDVVP
jgi:hypothetical protein